MKLCLAEGEECGNPQQNARRDLLHSATNDPDALSAGKYRGAYAATNPNEYFAEGTQSYFLAGEADGGKDRAWLARLVKNSSIASITKTLARHPSQAWS